ncbi:MAG: MaoC family dehydratase [Candidatus Heimdallarchaeota archaeon]|nr:MAG: MaoC family dehydratase [Candidatus Heimdallarchaeota archaeon]
MVVFSYSEIKVGQKASIKRTIRDIDIKKFAEISGDRNPIHLDEEYAKKTFFQGRIAHGMLSAALISAVLANELPGPGSIYLKQELTFIKPIRIGDTILVTVEVINKDDEKERVVLRTYCTNQHNELVVDGKATVMPMRS